MPRTLAQVRAELDRALAMRATGATTVRVGELLLTTDQAAAAAAIAALERELAALEGGGRVRRMHVEVDRGLA
jgi:hypothetical protein